MDRATLALPARSLPVEAIRALRRPGLASVEPVVQSDHRANGITVFLLHMTAEANRLVAIKCRLDVRRPRETRRFYRLSNTITLDTKALTSRLCVKPQALPIAAKSSWT